MDERHERRIAENEVTFRRVNEAIEPPDAAPDAVLAFVCECGRLGCTDTVALTRADYEAVRTGFERFVVVAGHEQAEVEDVVEDHGEYRIVAKTGAGRKVAAEDDTARGGGVAER